MGDKSKKKHIKKDKKDKNNAKALHLKPKTRQ
jgi:hypothetical protein